LINFYATIAFIAFTAAWLAIAIAPEQRHLGVIGADGLL
jgi:hypothetical protein